MLKKFINYFDIRLFPDDVSLGNKKPNKKWKKWIWTLIYYFMVVLGVIGKSVYDLLNAHNDIRNLTRHLILASIISIVILPKIVESAKIEIEEPNPMQLFICFQNGFFWSTVMQITQSGFVVK